MNILSLIGLILGTAETIIPIFLHNPKSQQVEGVIFTTANNLFNELSSLKLPVPPPTPATPPATVTSPVAS
jgi:hypothetical protein